MKINRTSYALVCGLAMGLGPWIFLENPSPWWLPISLFGGGLVAIVGYGAQMAQLGQGDTGEELLDEITTVLKNKVEQLRLMFRARDD